MTKLQGPDDSTLVKAFLSVRWSKQTLDGQVDYTYRENSMARLTRRDLLKVGLAVSAGVVTTDAAGLLFSTPAARESETPAHRLVCRCRVLGVVSQEMAVF